MTKMYMNLPKSYTKTENIGDLVSIFFVNVFQKEFGADENAIF